MLDGIKKSYAESQAKALEKQQEKQAQKAEKLVHGKKATMQQQTAQTIYQHQVKPFLKERDGFTHVVMINSFSKWINQNFGIEDKYTNQIDEIVTSIQQDGYEIVDIKFNSLQNQGISKNMEGFSTLIMYK